MIPYRPLFSSPHVQTIAASLWRRRLNVRRYPVEDLYFDTEPGVRVKVCRQRPAEPRGTLLAVHGLEGSSEAGYLRSLAQAALEAGYTVYRSNIRGCGGTEGLSNTLYHSGLTADLLFLLRELRRTEPGPLFLAGFSLGGNQVLKLAGELGPDGPALVEGICAVSTPIDLAECVRALARPENRLYEMRFVRLMRRRLRVRHRLMPDRFPLAALKGVRTVFEFDDRVTAPFFGFGSAENYYRTQSANRFLERIRIPTLLVQAKDDPMIPFAVYNHPAIRRNNCLELLATDHGGHVGFLSPGRPRFWLDAIIPSWIRRMGNNSRPDLVGAS